MARGHNTTYLQYTLTRGDAAVTLQLRPLCTARDYHWQRRGGGGFSVVAIAQGCRVETADGNPPLAITADQGTFRRPDGAGICSIVRRPNAGSTASRTSIHPDYSRSASNRAPV